MDLNSFCGLLKQHGRSTLLLNNFTSRYIQFTVNSNFCKFVIFLYNLLTILLLLIIRLDGKHVVFGKVLESSFGVLDKMEAVGSQSGKTSKKVEITKSGVL